MSDDNPYSPPLADSDSFPISPASRFRRRVAALGMILLGIVLFLLRSYRPISATVISPGIILWGCAALIAPVALPDPKREYGMLQLWIDSRRRGFWLGPAALSAGILVGLGLLVVL